MIPLSLHGDGTPSMGVGKSWGKVADFFSWASLLVTCGHSEMNRFLIYTINAHLRGTAQAMSVVFKAMVWSLEALLDRRWPAKNWLGATIDYSKRSLGKARPLSVSLPLYLMNLVNIILYYIIL